METLTLAYAVTATFLARGGWIIAVYLVTSGIYLAAQERAYRHDNR